MRVAATIFFLCIGLVTAWSDGAPMRPETDLSPIIAKAPCCSTYEIEELDCLNPGTGCPEGLAR
jgi:hypothetical protein